METPWLYVVGTILMVLLLAVLWKRIIRALLLLSGLGLAGAVVYVLAQQASATRQVATVATVAARGNTAGTMAIALLLALIFIGVVVGGYVALRRWYLARTGRNWNGYPAQLSQEQYPSVGVDAASVNALLQLELLRALRELRTPQAQTMLAVRDDDDEDYGEWWGNA
jgi:hypothetical protein